MKDIANGIDGGEFTFTANDGGVVHTYTCTFNGWTAGGANLQIGWITDENNHQYWWGRAQVEPVNIEAYIGYLKEYADLKVKEAKKALINDSLALLKIERVLSFLDSAMKEKVLSEIETVVPGITQAVERLNTDYQALKDLKQNAESIRNSFDPKGKNPEDVIKNVVNFHKQAEAIVEDLSTLLLR